LTAASGVGRWDWMDGSMLNNERRNQWLAEVTVARLERVLKVEVLDLKILREFLRALPHP
jgi:hypothetical protein